MASLGKRLWRWLGTLFASVVIFLAVALGVFRLMLPLVPEYHVQLQDWASRAVGLPVRIGKIDARWRLKGPELYFADAEVLSEDETEVLIRADSGSVGVSLFGLLRERQLQAGWVELVGARVNLHRSAEGKVRLQGFEPPAKQRERTRGPLSVIPKGTVELIDAQIHYLDEGRDGAEWIFSNVDLLVQYRGSQLNFNGQVSLPRSLGSFLELSVEAAGNLKEPETLDWQLLLEGETLNLAGWRKMLPIETYPVTGSGDASIWFAVADGRLQQAAVTADLSDLSTTIEHDGLAGPVDLDLSQLSGMLQWDRSEQGWTAAARDLRLARDNDAWPASDIEVLYTDAGEYQDKTVNVTASFVRFDELSQFLSLLPPSESIPDLTDIALVGEIRNLDAVYRRPPGNGAPLYHVEAAISDLGLIAPDDVPQVTGLSGLADFDHRGGRLLLDTHDLSLRFLTAFRNDIDLSRVDGELTWRFVGRDSIRVSTDELSLLNPDLSLRGAGDFTYWRDGRPPRLKVQADVSDVDLSQLSTYLAKRIPPKVLKWLDTGIVDGTLTDGRIIYNGPLKRRPFDKGEARMWARLTIEDATIDYLPGWPEVRHINADVSFEDATMAATVMSAEISGAEVDYAFARIPNMYESPLDLTGTATGSLDKFIDFVRASPLIDQLGKGFDDLEAQGRGIVEAKMNVRLRKWHENDFNVTVRMDDGVVGFTNLRHKFVNVNGQVNVTPIGLAAQEVDATLLGRPVLIDMFPILDETGSRSATVMTVAGTTDADLALDALNVPIGPHVDGLAEWNARVHFPRNDLESGEHFSIDIRSDLQGVAVDLPEPLTKDSSDTRRLAMNFLFTDDSTIDLGMDYGPDVRGVFELDVDEQGWRFRRGGSVFGEGEPTLPLTDGLVLTGTVESVDLDQWLSLQGDGPRARQLSDYLTSVDLDIAQFDFYRQIVNDATFRLNHNNREWLVQIDSETVAGSMFVPFDLDGNTPIVADFERLPLQFADDEDNPGEPMDPAGLPAMEVNAAEFSLGDRRLGALKASLVKIPQGIKLQHFETEASTFTTRGSGEWTMTGGEHQSSLTLALDSTDVKTTSQYLGYAGSVTGKKGTAMFDVSWPDAPSGEFMKVINGTASINLESGQMTDLEPGAGRIFGLLSVTALPRRLSLDFRDVFDKGFGYDSIAGDFYINQGDAYTENLVLKGPAANVGIVGRIGLAAEDYDQVAIVNAKVGSALPVGVAIAVNPAIGAAMLILTEMLKDPFGELMELQYRVTGSWEDPVVERVVASQAAADSAATPASFR